MNDIVTGVVNVILILASIVSIVYTIRLDKKNHMSLIGMHKNTWTRIKKELLGVKLIGKIAISIFPSLLLVYEIILIFESKYGFIQGVLIFIIANIILFYVFFVIAGVMLYLGEKLSEVIINIKSVIIGKLLLVSIIMIYIISITIVLMSHNEKITNWLLIPILSIVFIIYKIIGLVYFNPDRIINKKEKNATYILTMFAIVIFISMIYSLTMMVYVASASDIGAFSNSELGILNSFYFTIITIFTIGYGDIVPLTVITKLIVILIAISSIMGISVFLSTIINFKGKIEEEEE